MSINPVQRAHAAPLRSQIKTDGPALPCTCDARLAGLPDARRSRWRTGGQTQWKLPARRSLEGDNRALEIHQIATLRTVRFRG
jgi:hypothetical protein